MIELTLADGRVLGIEDVTPVESMKLAEGTRELSANRGWNSLALVVASIRTINGIPNPFPTHKRHIEGLLKGVNDDDIKAIESAGVQARAGLQPVEIELKPLSPFEKLKIFEFAGEFNDVQGWFGPAFVAASVRKIGDKEIAFPDSQAALTDLVGELGLRGIASASLKMREYLDAADAKSNALEIAAKN